MGGDTYLWSPGGLTTESIIVNPTTNTTYTLTASSIEGCIATESVIVTVNPIPTATISGTISVCQNATSPNITFTNPQNLPVTITYNINGINQTTINVNASSSATVAAPTTTIGTYAYNLVSVSYQSSPACTNTISGTATVTVNANSTGCGTSSGCSATTYGSYTVLTFSTVGTSTLTSKVSCGCKPNMKPS